MNNAAGLLFAFLAVLVSCISLEKVLLQLMKKKKKNMQDFLFPAALGQSWWCEMLQADTKCHKTKLSDPIRCCRRERSHPPAPPRPSRSLSSLPRWLTLLPWQQVTRFLPSYINVPVIGEGGTTFLFVFLKNPSSGLLK